MRSLDFQSGGRIKVWDLPLRLFHWILVVAIAVAFLSSEEDSGLNDWHVLSGWVAASLLAFRLVWGFVGGEHSRFSDFLTFRGMRHHLSGLAKGTVEPTLGHNPLGSIAVVLLLVLVAVTVWSGAFLGESGEELHEIVAWVLLALVAVHVLAVVLTSLSARESLVRAMIDGTKPKERHPFAMDARRPGPVAMFLGAAALFGAIFTIQYYDPDAFKLRSAESFEHRSDGSKTATSYETEAENEED